MVADQLDRKCFGVSGVNGTGYGGGSGDAGLVDLDDNVASFDSGLFGGGVLNHGTDQDALLGAEELAQLRC